MSISIQALGAALAEHARRRPDRAQVVSRMRALLEHAPQPFVRSALDPGHFTASAFVLCSEGRRVLLVKHQKLGRWLQPGGHIEASDASVEAAARREVLEETGVAELELLGDGIFDVDAHPIPATAKEGPHTHFDVRYAFAARSDQLCASDEVGGARWVPLPEVASLNPEESVVRCTARLARLRE